MKVSNTLLLVLLFLAVFLPFSYSNWGLTETSEARYAEISKEMYETGDFLVPELMGMPHLHKPPVTYYLTSMGYAIFGVNEYGARFFLHVALFLQVVLVFCIAMLLYKDRRIAVAAALFYFSFPIVQIAAKNLTTDAFLTSFIFAAIFSYLKFRDKRKIIFLYIFYVLAGIAFLTKGPVAVLPIFIFALCYKIIQKEKIRFGFHDVAGIFIFLLISGSWFVGLLIKDPSLFTYFTQHQLVDRVKGNSFNRQAPFWYYIVLMPVVALPGFIFFVDWLIQYFRKKTDRTKTAKLLLIPLAIMFVVFSASSSKLVLYILPLYLFIALGAAEYVVQLSAQKLKIYNRIALGFGIVLLLALAIASYFDFSLVVPKGQVLPASVVGIFLLFIAYKKFNTETFSPAIINALMMATLVFIIPFIMKANETAINSTKEIAASVNIQNRSGVKKILVYDELLPSLAFYTPNPIQTIHVANYKSLREQFQLKGAVPQKRFSYYDDANDLQKLHAEFAQQNTIIVAPRKFPVPDSVKIFLPKNGMISFGKKWQLYY